MFSRIRQLIDQLRAKIEQLSARDQRLMLIGIGAGFGIIFVVSIYFMVSSVADKRARIEASRNALTEVLALETQYQKAKDDVEEGKRLFRDNKISLLTFMQKAAERLGLPLGELSESPPEPVPESDLIKTSVVVNIKQLSIDRLTAFLHEIEEGSGKGLVKVMRLKVKKRYDDPKQLETTLTISTWKTA